MADRMALTAVATQQLVALLERRNQMSELNRSLVRLHSDGIAVLGDSTALRLISESMLQHFQLPEEFTEMSMRALLTSKLADLQLAEALGDAWHTDLLPDNELPSEATMTRRTMAQNYMQNVWNDPIGRTWDAPTTTAASTMDSGTTGSSSAGTTGIDLQIPTISHAGNGHYDPNTPRERIHVDYHLRSYYIGNYRGVAEGDYWRSRLETITVTQLLPDGDYIYIVVNDADYQRMVKVTRDGKEAITSLLPDRTNYKPCNWHFTARDALCHYLGLRESNYEADLFPHLLAIKLDYKQLLLEDSKRDYDDRKFGTFNRHYMEHSMYSFEHYLKCFLADHDYDHYRVTIGTKENYVRSMEHPVYFDYTSPVTKAHIISHPYLAREILCSRDWARFVDDYDTHYKNVLGELMHHISGEVMNYHYHRNTRFPTEQASLRVNREITNWFAMQGQTTGQTIEPDEPAEETIDLAATGAARLLQNGP